MAVTGGNGEQQQQQHNDPTPRPYLPYLKLYPLQWLCALRHASNEFMNDREIVLAAVG